MRDPPPYCLPDAASQRCDCETPKNPSMAKEFEAVCRRGLAAVRLKHQIVPLDTSLL